MEDNLEKLPLSWSADGRFILYQSTGSPTASDLSVLPLSGDRKPIQFLKTQFSEIEGQFSPDGRWVVYVSNESGRQEVYVAPFPGPGGKWQVSTAGGSWPRWRPDGNEIFYLTPDSNLMAVAVNGKRESFEIGAEKALFEISGARPGGYRYDVSADGQRFLVNMPTIPRQLVRGVKVLQITLPRDG